MEVGGRRDQRRAHDRALFVRACNVNVTIVRLNCKPRRSKTALMTSLFRLLPPQTSTIDHQNHVQRYKLHPI